jgi:hypothetical protein
MKVLVIQLLHVYEIAKICSVSQPFIAAMRDLEVKKRQAENDKRRTLKDAQKIKDENAENTSGTSSEKATPPVSDLDFQDGEAPSQEELEAAKI